MKSLKSKITDFLKFIITPVGFVFPLILLAILVTLFQLHRELRCLNVQVYYLDSESSFPDLTGAAKINKFCDF